MLPDPLLWLLPAVFVLHEVEETVFLPVWLRRHRSELMSRFPRLSGRLLPRLDGISRKEFAIMAVEESLLLVGATACASFVSWPYPWLALFLAFGLHLVVHLFQCLLLWRYVPVVVTSLTGLIYCGWGLGQMVGGRMFDFREYLLCGVAGVVVAVVNLMLMHSLASAFRRHSMP